MTPNDVKGGERYVFFKSTDYYMLKVESVESKNEAGSDENYCNSFLDSSLFTYISNPRVFCARFKKMYTLLLNSSNRGKLYGSLDDMDRAFLNYWLNDKLSGIDIDTSICVNDFYNKIKASSKEIFKDTLLEKKLHNIEKHNLINMRKLYDLYKIKSKLNAALADGAEAEESASCLSYAKECYKKYIDAIINCDGGCFDFYSALTEFRNKFKEELSPFAEKSISCNYQKLFELPHYEIILNEYKSRPFKTIITLPVLFPLFVVFFMIIFSDQFTPFRQHILEKIKKTKNMLFGEGERDNEFMPYTSNNDISILSEGEYNISYYT
ncbi:PIR Superfamily Protein, partial [Plasmodium ovale curtisi]